MLISPVLILGFIVVIYLIISINILAEYERGVIFRLGKLLPAPKGPGVILVFAPIDRIVRVSLRTVVMDVPPQDVLDQHTEPWGIKVASVEVKQVDLPPDMQRAMARQAEAEREKRAKIIHAAGELEASQKLSQAAHVIATEPTAITLRYLQTLTEIASEKNSTIVFPLPIEMMHLLKQFIGEEKKT